MQHTTNNNFKRHFNLIEILVALAILTIGMVALIGIIPVATNTLQNANDKLHAANVGHAVGDIVIADSTGLTTQDSLLLPKLQTTVTATASITSTIPAENELVLAYSSDTIVIYKTNTTGYIIVKLKTKLENSAQTVTDFTSQVFITFNKTTSMFSIEVMWPITSSPAQNRAAGRSYTFHVYKPL